MSDMETIQAIYEEQKRNYSAFASYVWLACGLYLFTAEPTLSLLSLKALVYFAVGTFVAALVFGFLTHLLIKMLAKTVSGITLSLKPGTAVILGVAGLLLMIIEAVVIYYTAAFLLME